MVVAQCGGESGHRVGVLGEGDATVGGDQIVAIPPLTGRGDEVSDPPVAVAHHRHAIAAHLLFHELEPAPWAGEMQNDFLHHLLQI